MTIRRLALALTATATLTTGALAQPALWEVSDGDSSIWLFGSVHLLQPNTNWRSALLDKVIAKADRVYFETDIGPAAQAKIMPLTFDLGFNRDGRLLSEIIGPEMTADVRAAAAAYDLPMPTLLTMKPWMAATTLSMGPLLDTGYQAELGVDLTLSTELPEDKKGYLETPEQQLGFLANGDEAEQIAMLRATLDTLDVMAADIDSMIDAWLNGQPEILGEVFMEQMGDYDSGMVERIIDLRNHDWTDQIEAMLARNERALLVVGAAHLVDEISVVRLLEQRGHTSTRLQ